ncbi:MAG TPA: response regulator [Sphingobium sp.]|jgi:DNA-binding response OmpR family regulator|uniref:response regulator n=1 Tax=unclassified Sphingobium TaxID=2611147 RepID=UPI0007F38F17|nr:MULTISPECIES: response regulator [unclassified Sphingobium]OAN56371.1 response regulator [Sphingobium sp. TCM1]HAF40472.1 response regulator [Sphingobium sp.]
MFFGLVKEGDVRGPRRKAVRTVLVVEDEPLVAFDNEHALEQAGYRIAATVDEYGHAVRVIDEGGVDLVIADVALHGEKSGVDVARHAAALGLPVLFVTGRCPIDARTLAVGCLAKPYAPRELVAAIHVVDAVLRGARRPKLPHGLSLFAAEG